jgi:ABC-type phosphate transport system permease subunit
MLKLKNTLRAMSISALILAPIAIGLAIYLISHPTFFNILQEANDFGIVLSVLLASVIVFSSVWLIAGIKQYRLIDSWNKRYQFFITRKEEMDAHITVDLALDGGIQE